MGKLQRIFIANRGEIAVRIIHACQDTGRTAIVGYAEPDADALFVRLADEAYALGAAETADTYLNIDAMVSAAVRAHADAVHPGYGFLAENADFAQAVIDAGLVWVGPKPETIRVLGSKVAARRIAAEVGAPMAPGTTQPVQDAAEVVEFAREHGLPIAIKAVYGGGGRGLKVVHEPDEVAAAFESATHEAEVAFGNGDCFVERFLARPRHVEVQVLGDQFGTVLAVGTRDCSLQRRNQKLIEEAPAPFLAAETVRELERAAVAICSRAHYESAGTVEFLVDDGTMSFMEVNTRIQVEHPVTEAVTGVDLVAAQLAIAEGAPVEAVPGLESGVTPEPRGHAMEFRINAEDPSLGFVPFPGVVERLQVPTGPGIRFDSGVAAGDSISSRYDSMIAKLIVKAPTRAECLRRAERALAELHIHGVPTVVPFDKAVLESADFGAAADWKADDGVANANFRVYTRWIEEELLPNLPAETLEDWRRAGEQAMGERSGEAAPVESWVEVDGKRVTLGLPSSFASMMAFGAGMANAGGRAPATGASGADSDLLAALLGGLARSGSPETAPDGAVQDGTLVTAELGGTVVRWLADDGAPVREGDPIVVLEAMKMEREALAPATGTLHITVSVGDQVDYGAPLGTIS